jgi:hypothetical protein
MSSRFGVSGGKLRASTIACVVASVARTFEDMNS